MAAHQVDNGPTASARVAMAQVERMRRAELSATNKVARGDAGDGSTKSAVFRLERDHQREGAVPGLVFVASPGQLYEVECFGGFVKAQSALGQLKAPPVLDLDLPSGEMIARQTATDSVIDFRAIVAIGENGGDVALKTKGGTLTCGLFFMRATAL